MSTMFIENPHTKILGIPRYFQLSTDIAPDADRVVQIIITRVPSHAKNKIENIFLKTFNQRPSFIIIQTLDILVGYSSSKIDGSKIEESKIAKFISDVKKNNLKRAKSSCYDRIGRLTFESLKNTQQMDSISRYLFESADFISRIDTNVFSPSWNYPVRQLSKTDALNEFLKRQVPRGNAGILIFTEIRGKPYYLLQKKINKITRQTYWNIPGGKSEKSDINYIHTAIREFLEEAGLKNSIQICDAERIGLIHKLGLDEQNRDYFLIILRYENDRVKDLILKEGTPGEVDLSYSSKLSPPGFTLSPGYEWMSRDILEKLKDRLSTSWKRHNPLFRDDPSFQKYVRESEEIYQSFLSETGFNFGPRTAPFSTYKGFETSDIILNVLD